MSLHPSPSFQPDSKWFGLFWPACPFSPVQKGQKYTGQKCFLEIWGRPPPPPPKKCPTQKVTQLGNLKTVPAESLLGCSLRSGAAKLTRDSAEHQPNICCNFISLILTKWLVISFYPITKIKPNTKTCPLFFRYTKDCYTVFGYTHKFTNSLQQNCRHRCLTQNERNPRKCTQSNVNGSNMCHLLQVTVFRYSCSFFANP